MNTDFNTKDVGGFIGLAQINIIAGDIEYNTNKIIHYIEEAKNLNLDIIFFPLNALIGYDMQSFIMRYPFILDECENALKKIANKCNNISTLIPYIDSNKQQAYAIIKYGKIEKILHNCEYISSKEFNDGVEFLIKPIATPSFAGNQYIRENRLKNFAIKNKRSVVEINQVGAIDSISFAGQSCISDENGNIFSRAEDFKEQLLVINPFHKIGKLYSSEPTPLPESFSIDYEWDLERTYKSAVQGIRDYFTKCNLKRAVLGLSGGLDSTICSVLLVEALGKDNVFGISMPSKLTSDESKTDAFELAKNLDIPFTEASIKSMYENTKNNLNDLFENIEQKWDDRYKESFTSDNIQARSRAIYLWGVANEFSSCIPIATSDKSELYMGYATINGDMSGGFAPIADITKTKLFALAKWINKNTKFKNAIPESVILKRPGAELAIDPNTGKTLCAEDALMPYEFLDEIIWRIENKNQNYQELLNAKFIYENKVKISLNQKQEWINKFFRKMSFALYKSYIMPPYTIIDANTINKILYSQPITSSRINYKISI